MPRRQASPFRLSLSRLVSGLELAWGSELESVLASGLGSELVSASASELAWVLGLASVSESVLASVSVSELGSGLGWVSVLASHLALGLPLTMRP
jgi:hypothetical protein